ncbi:MULTISPECIES: DHA2 family efflux MFS transporter permease subunit [unclassified Streptomyces]|uniref:DHA2 family efflux MFS transporter permease subunit n=1 Tax=unclassified Streptomyces TaxID=2593676 RepID=UPI0006B03473|nr:MULTISPECIES: DHA2 family efflux MFS transporter permease subunit [unclassified Streptomyces]KOU85675.1 major facilitator transporter [Streptomyces sp. XY58]KOV05168.1 major facilitator transporter [Streptomyces sp. XY37]KOV50011.1 major facilitator transporter [Streptomyces sp. MMG1064]
MHTQDSGTKLRGPAVWALVLTGVASFMAALDNLVVTTALPAIREDLGGGLEDLEWTVNAYTLTFAVLLMFGAALGDRFGRRRLFIAGLAVFTGASAAAALSPGIDALIAARAVQGVGAAVMMPLTLTLLTAAVPAARRGMALGIYGAVTGLAVASGPLIGGSLTEHISWQWIFWLNVPTGLALIPLARLRLAESTAPGARLDIPGTLLISGGLFGIVYALVNANAEGWTSAPVLTGLILGSALVAGFVHHGATHANPMLPMRLFRDRGFLGINLASLLMFLGMFGSIFLLSQFLQGVAGYSPTEAGLRMLPWTGMPMIVAPLAGILSDRIGGRPVVAAGLAFQALGLGWFAAILSTDVSYAAQLPPLVLSGIGMALYFAPAANVLMSTVRPADQGRASGANNALRELGGALGVAVLASVFSAQGGYESPQAFTDGTVPALWIGAAAVALAAALALLVPRRSKTAPVPAGRTAAALEKVPAAG